jgi:hypothetical protein
MNNLTEIPPANSKFEQTFLRDKDDTSHQRTTSHQLSFATDVRALMSPFKNVETHYSCYKRKLLIYITWRPPWLNLIDRHMRPMYQSELSLPITDFIKMNLFKTLQRNHPNPKFKFLLS